MKPKGKSFKRKDRKSNDNSDIIEDLGEPKKWYDEISADPKQFNPVADQILIELKDEAKKCLDAEIANYNIKNSKDNSDYRWMKTATSQGTVSDKVAASVILIQNNSLTNLEMLSNLIATVKVGKKRECLITIEALTELFLNNLLKPNVKLKPFHQRPLSLLNELASGNTVTRKKYLSYWYFEDQLKEIYTTFVLALNKVSHDTVDANKEKAIRAMYQLLSGNPEQEKNLLSYLINKFGDPSQKIASKAIYCLGQLLFEHPNMQEVVLLEVEKLLFRQNISHRAQYYGLCYLSQFYLDHDSSHIAKKLIEVYFAFFNSCVKTGDIDSRMMSALLMGVNRAYPYAKLDVTKISGHIDTMYRIVHVANFNIALHTLSLLYQISDCSENVNDRFYSALYRKLLDPKLSVTTHQAMLLNLIYKALGRDKEIGRVMSFVKRLLQIALITQPSFSCAILYLIAKLCSENPSLVSLVLEEKDSSVLNKFDDDDDEERTVVEEIGDGLNESKPEENSNEECKNEDATVKIKPEEDVKPDLEELDSKIGGSWLHRLVMVKQEREVKSFNPLARNPLYSGGEFSAYTELTCLVNHFHPSVALFAKKILDGKSIDYPGDPLKDFTLIRFLERFVFKNPKGREELKHGGAHPTFGKRKSYRPEGMKSFAVNSAKYLSSDEKNVPVDELFMYKFMQKRQWTKKKTSEDDESDVESVCSEDFEEMLDKMHGFKSADEDIDYMNEIGGNLKKRKKNDKQNDEDDEDDEEEELEDDEELEDEGDDFENDDEIDLSEEDLDDDDDDDMFLDSDADDDESNKKKKKQIKKSGGESVFAAAEEFASLLEDEGASSKPGSSNTFANKDKADLKQLDWEDKRNRWLNSYKKAVGKKFDFKSNNSKRVKTK